MTDRPSSPVSEEGNGNGGQEPEPEPTKIPLLWHKAKQWVDELDVHSCHHLYHIFNGNETYLERTRTELRADFGEYGIDAKWHNDLLWIIDHQRAVHYAGPLSGRKAGLHIYQTRKLLCTEGPRIIEARKGKCETIAKILKSLFGEEQLPYVIGWLSTARASMLSGSLKPGQALIMAGPVDTGKSFTQKYIFTPILGGRHARPFLFMAGKTGFNEEHLQAEHLIFDDEAGEDDPRMRNAIGAMIRQTTSSDDAHCHGKGLKGLTLPLFARLSISCNDDEKGLLSLPPLNTVLATKIILCKAYEGDFDWPVNDHQRMHLIELVKAEYSAFAYWLDHYKIPTELQDKRYGVKAYQNEEVARKAAGVGHEHELLTIVREAILKDYERRQRLATSEVVPPPFPYEGTASQIFELIWAAEHLREGLRRITQSPDGLGRILKRLANAGAPGIARRLSDGRSMYKILEVEQENE